MNNGYIYIRSHVSYDNYNVCKLGKTMNLIERNSTYKTGEVECGSYELVIKVQKQKLDIIERLLQFHFKSLGYHYYLDGGTEFFKKDIISLIIPYLKTLNLQFTILSKEQIKSIIWKNTNIKKIFNKININNLKNILKFSCKNNETNEIIIPREHQINVLLKIDEFYKNNDRGRIIHSCGLGKALLGILIVRKLNCKSVVIGVPSIYLQKQMKNEIMRIFNNHKNILYIGGEIEKNENYIIESTIKEDDINKFINKKSSDCKFVITTYDSCNKLSNIKFDFKIGDEAHHLVGSEYEKTKDSFHKIKSNKSLFMTATEKVIENNRTNNIIYTMDDKNIFGELIDAKSINWAIENKKITDYNLIILKNTENEINNIINSLNLDDNEDIIYHKDLFLSAFMALKSIEKYNDLTHILIYTNKTENSELVKKYIDVILELNIININKENYYNKALHSNSKEKLNDIKLLDSSIKVGELTKFMKASWGIISSVYIFSEGFDCPRLNGVVFGENMESDIRIVQSTLRPNRLDSKFPDKKAYVIIPYIDTENFITDNKSFDKCRKIITKIRNIDEKIEQKINVVSLNKLSSKLLYNPNEKIKYHNIIENYDELTKIILRLRYSKALSSQYSEEQDEFNYVRQLNKELNIQSKEEYTFKVIKDKHKNYIENPEEYFKLKAIWSNWYDFIGVDTKKFIQDKNNWINFCKENNVKSLEDYKELCKLYEELPINPADFYIGCLDIDIELEFDTKRRKYSE
uniref:Helicase ATP-binding domain-containing protein n=1 Tax=viral metagenome TaxID=1070528 RepID=A0A6C0EF14_9ZZZZ